MKLKRRTKFALGFFVLFVVTAFLQIPWGRIVGRPFVISEETTFLTEPKNSYGGIDYLEAINQKLRQGVTPENNAVVDLLKVIRFEVGESDSGYEGPVYERFCHWLGAEYLPPSNAIEDLESIVLRNYPPRLPKREESRIRTEYWEIQCQPWTSVDRPQWAAALETQQEALNGVVRATQKTRFYYPVVGDFFGRCESMENYWNGLTYELGKAVCGLRARAMHHLGVGDIENAIDDVKAIRRLARLHDQSTSTSDSLYELASVSETVLIRSGKLSRKQLVGYHEFLERMHPAQNTRLIFDNFERFVVLDVIQQHATGGHLEFYNIQRIAECVSVQQGQQNLIVQAAKWVDWNSAMVKANELMDRCVDALGEPLTVCV